MGPRPLRFRRVPDVRNHRALSPRRALAERPALHAEHLVVVGLSVDLVGGRRSGGRPRHGRARADANAGSIDLARSRRGWRRGDRPVYRRTARRVRSRLPRLLRLRCGLAELLLLAGGRRKECLAAGTGLLHRGLFYRSRDCLQFRASCTFSCDAALNQVLRRTTMSKSLFVALALSCLSGVAVAQTTPQERLVRSRAVEAAIWGMPVVNYDLMLQEMLTKTPGKVNQVIYWGKPLDWKNQTLTPNPDTLYFMTFLNTKDVGPIVIEIPPADANGSLNANIVNVW